MNEPVYEVVSPRGDPRDARDTASASSIGMAAPLATLAGRRIGLVWTAFANGEILLDALRTQLLARFPDLTFAELMPGRGLRWGDYPDPSIGDCARELAIDAAIVTAGC